MTINCISEHGQRMLQAVLDLLAVKARTREELQVALGVSKPTARRYLELLRTEPRRVFICRWQHTLGNLAPVYAAGSKADKKRPKRPTKYEYQKIRWQRIKANRLSALIIAPVGAIPRTPPTRRRAEHAEQ